MPASPMRLINFVFFRKALSFGAARLIHSKTLPDPRNLRVGLRVDLLRAREYMVMVFTRRIFTRDNK